MDSSGSMVAGTHMYSARSMCVARLKYFMFMHMKLASRVEMVLLKSNLEVVRSSVWVDTSPG